MSVHQPSWQAFLRKMVFCIVAPGEDGDPDVSVATFGPTTDKASTGMRQYITMTVPRCGKRLTDNVNLPLRIVVTIPALSVSDPTDTTADE